jgi:hypothetical protein
MNFSELSQIVKYLRKTLPCSSCQTPYELEDIEVLSTFDDQGLFNLRCAKCQNQLLVHITISDDDKKQSEQKNKGKQQIIRTHRSITEKEIDKQMLSPNQISSDDIIDMHMFLNQFNGDFKQLFSKKK